MKKLFPLLFLLLLPGCKEHARPEPAPATPPSGADTLTVMAWNVEALFDLVANGAEFPEYTPDPFNWNADMHRRKLANIAAVIAAANPDIAVLCEVENENATAELQEALAQAGRHYPYRAVGATPNRSVTCPVIISRFPIRDTRGLGLPKSDTFSTRNILEADIAIGQRTLKIFSMHWPTKSHPEEQRIAVAELLAARLAELPAHTDYILAGDLNTDYDEAEKVFTISTNAGEGKVGMQHILHTVLSAPGRPVDYVTESQVATASDPALHYDLWLELPEDQRYCYRYKGRNSTLDHFLLPAALYDSCGFDYVDNSFSVFTWNGRLMVDGMPYRWKMRRDKTGFHHVGEGYSDHLPILAKFHAGPFSSATASQPSGSAVAISADGRQAASGGVGFENGFDGWIACDRGVTLARDSTTAAEGTRSLRIEGRSADNCTAARVRLVPGTLGLGTGRIVALRVKGSGKWAVRLKPAEPDGCAWQYLYWNGTRMVAAKRPKYVAYSSAAWHTVRAAITGNRDHAAPIDLEIRIGKEMPLRLWIDAVKLMP
jgi:endonuclease/exonuclease/phosphatase family metal-dependent hydrolase